MAILIRTPTVTLSVLGHAPAAAREDPSAEQVPHDAISFVEDGSFTVRSVRPPHLLARSFGPGMLFVTPRGSEFACEHHDTPPTDRCLSVGYSADVVDSLRIAGLPGLRLAGVQATARQRFLRQRLRALSMVPADGVSTLRLELIAAALFESVVCTGVRSELDRAPASVGVMRRIARAAELIETEYARPLTLTDIASAAEMSPYHFGRSFGSLVGVPPHRYLVAVRLREAVRRIGEGASVTATCYAVGFSSPSHFTTAFRRQFGVLPSLLGPGRCTPLVRAAMNAAPWGRRVRGARCGSP
jgi:AraC-like DNA-binding protein